MKYNWRKRQVGEIIFSIYTGSMLRVISYTISYCILFLITMSATADDKVLLEGDWTFQYGDDPSWSQLNIDDKNWSSIKVPSLVKQLHKNPINGWYRLHFDAMVNINEPQALMIESLRHSDETWINGLRVGGEGTFEEPWHFTQTNPAKLIRVYEIPAGLLKPKGNLLAIKVNIGFGHALGAMFPGGAGILSGHVYLGDADILDEYKQKDILVTSAIDVFFITLGLVDIFIILFLLRNSLNIFPEFKWLFFSSFIMFLASSSHDFFYIQELDFINVNLLMVIALLCMPISIALYFWGQYRNIRIRHVQLIVTLWIMTTLLILIPSLSTDIKVFSWYVWMVLASIFFAYALFCAFYGVYIGHIGSMTQLIAVIIFLISIRTQWLPDNFFGHRNVQIGSMFYRYALLFAYFQKIKHIHLDYKNLSQRVVNIADDIYANLARELHDGIGQHLASIKLQTKLAKMHCNSNIHLLNIEKELTIAVTGLRRLLVGLHPVLVDKYQITEALEKESQHLENLHSIRIQLITNSIKLEKAMEHQIFRVFQECIHNAIKHGHASKIKVQLIQKHNFIIIDIKDNGFGFNTKKKSTTNNAGGLGLISLHERIALLNGQLNIKSKKNQGTHINIGIPLIY